MANADQPDATDGSQADEGRSATMAEHEPWTPITTEPDDVFTSHQGMTAAGALTGGLVAAAGAAILAAADKDPRRRAYRRRMVGTGAAIALGGIALIVALAAIF